MISVSRSLIRQFRSLLKRSVLLYVPKSAPLAVVFQASQDGLTIYAQQEGVTLICRAAGRYDPEVLAVPVAVLDEFEGKGKNTVTLQATTSSEIWARWDDQGVPRSVHCEAVKADKVPALPELPNDNARSDTTLLKALDEAMQTTDTEAVRYALQNIKMRGQAGEIVATNGRELLIQSGFQFPWKEDVLVPRITALGCRDLTQEDSVTIGKTKTHICLQLGFWIICLRIDTESRFPDVQTIIPTPTSSSTRLIIDPEDAVFLLRALPRLPGQDGEHSPITVDLDGQAVVRSKGEDSTSATELLLARSGVSGRGVRFATNRAFLARALQLGFHEFTITSTDKPVLCQDGTRKYLWMILGKEGALQPGSDAVRVSSTGSESAPVTASGNGQKAANSESAATETIPVAGETPAARPPRKRAVTSSYNGHETNGQAQQSLQPGDSSDLITEVEALKTALRDAYGRTNQVLAAIRRQQKQSKALKSTLASLRQLQLTA